MVPGSALQVDIFVSNVDHKRSSTVTEHSLMMHSEDGNLAPPAPGFMNRNRSGSTSSVDSVDDSGRDLVDMSYLPAAHNGDVYHYSLLATMSMSLTTRIVMERMTAAKEGYVA